MKDKAEDLSELDPRERRALGELRKAMRSGGAVDAEGVGKVLPEAVAISQAEGPRLPKSMVETTERAIGISAEENPEVLSEALFPVIGPAIRKAVERLVSEALFKLDAGLEKGLSPKRLGWRLQSLRSGVPYYEIVLRNTIVFRVEHVFLIHKATGVLLADIAQPGPSKLADKDMVASMLTAVRDYIKDSLSLQKGASVDVLKAGEYSVIAEEGPLALLALVVRGTPDPALRGLAQDVLETVHARLGPALRAFDGETEPFERAAGLLGPCLACSEKGAARKTPARAIVLLCAVAAVGTFFAARGAVVAARDRAFVAALEAEPGIVVVEARRSGGKLRGTVMQAVGTRPLAALAAERGVAAGSLDFEVEPYIAPGLSAEVAPAPTGISPAPVAPAATAAPIAPAPTPRESPDGEASGGRLPSPDPGLAAPGSRVPGAGGAGGATTAYGARPAAAGNAAPAGGDRRTELAALEARLSSIVILFEKDSERPSPGQDEDLKELRSIARRLVELAAAEALRPRIEAVGHAAGAARDAAGDSLSVRRARAAVALVAAGAPELSSCFVARGTGSAEPLAREAPGEASPKNRSVSFTAIFR